MNEQIIAIYCICDEFIKAKGFTDWHNVKMSTSEIMCLYIVAMRFFYGNVETARHFLKEHGYMPKCLSKSGVNKRIHQIALEWWHEFLPFIQLWSDKGNIPSEYIVDTFPVSVCRNIRIQRCRLYQGEDFRGYNASKREYFYGLKVTVVTTTAGCPVEVMLCPGREHDLVPFRFLNLQLPRGSQLFGDAAFTDYDHEDNLLEAKGIRLIADRKSGCKRSLALEDYVALKYSRGMIETAFSMIANKLPRKIHAVTQSGFEIKVLCFVIMLATNFLNN